MQQVNGGLLKMFELGPKGQNIACPAEGKKLEGGHAQSHILHQTAPMAPITNCIMQKLMISALKGAPQSSS